MDQALVAIYFINQQSAGRDASWSNAAGVAKLRGMGESCWLCFVPPAMVLDD